MKTIWSAMLLSLLGTGVSAQGTDGRIGLSEDLWLTQISDKAYVHTSTADVEGFGHVAANGLLLVADGEAFLVDSPWTDAQTKRLADWIADSLHARLVGFVPTHWHRDCMGGLNYLQRTGVPSYANRMTIDIARTKGLPVPEQGFRRSLALEAGGLEIRCCYPGGGHSTDNIVVWIPSEQILFGGCLLKDIRSNSKGNTSDADMGRWPVTLRKIQRKYPGARTVIPGHGLWGGPELIGHTIGVVTGIP